MVHRHRDRLRESQVADELPELVPVAVQRPLPFRERCAGRGQNFSLREIAASSDELQRLVRGGRIIKHQRRFGGVADSACGQLQIIFGMRTQGDQGQQDQ
ncbi:hypothetical protein SRABI106_01425 [Rahnella aquatilis]|nr:hypothetical protein SRABI106_01425 [Rahnella aquatilis]